MIASDERAGARRATPGGARPAVRAPSLVAVAAFAVLAAIFVFALAPRFDGDFWWHLKDGQYIAMHYTVPSHDFMSYVFAGHTWIDHEWLPELLMYGLYRLGGLQGPVVFYAIVIALTFTLVYLNMVQRGIRRLLALVVLILAALASTGSWGPRVQMLTLLFLAVYALALYRFEVTRDRRWLAVLPIMMLLWANSHGGFVLGLLLLAIAIVGESLNRRTGLPGAMSGEDVRALGVTFLVTAAVTLVNPNGIRQLLYPLTFVRPNPFTNLIAESASPNFHLFIFLVFGVMLLGLLAALYAGRRPLNWTHLLLIVAVTYLALEGSRNVPVWCVLISPLLAVCVQEALGWVYVDRRLAGGIKSVINVAFVLLITVACIRGAASILAPSTVASFTQKSFPTRAVSYMRTHRLPSHVFVAYTWGGYLLWNLYPEYRVYMDSRADTLYTAQILNGYEDMYNAAPNWKARLTQYRVNDVLVPLEAPLAQVLAEDPGWRRAYRDDQATIYVRS